MKMIVGVDPKNTHLTGEDLQREVVRSLATLVTWPLIGRISDGSYVVSTNSEYPEVWEVRVDGYVYRRKESRAGPYLEMCRANTACTKGCGCKCVVDDGVEERPGGSQGKLHCSQIYQSERALKDESYMRIYLECDERRAYGDIAMDSFRTAGPQGLRGFNTSFLGPVGMTGSSAPQ